MRGTRRSDMIVALGGNDRVPAGRDDDLVCGGGGNDRLVGERGSDRLPGGSGRHQPVGLRGSDRCQGGPGRPRRAATAAGGAAKSACAGQGWDGPTVPIVRSGRAACCSQRSRSCSPRSSSPATERLLIAVIIIYAGRRDLITGPWRQVIPAAGAALAYGTASVLGGSGFIAAFVAGIAFRVLLRRDPEQLNLLTEELGGVLNGVTFLLFGAILLGPTLGDVSWELVLYALLSLTLVRMVPVTIAMWRSRARLPTLGFLGWFGPRGLASIVFAVIVIEESQLPHQHTIVLAIYLTVGVSVFAHGLTAAPLAKRYARWYSTHPRDEVPPMESAPAQVTRVRGPAAPPSP